MTLMGAIQLPTNPLDFFVRAVEISSYIPGRIRLRSKNLVGNAGLEREVQARLKAYKELSSVETNIVTGSILLTYQPEILRRNADLKKIEDYIILHAPKRK